MTFNFQNFVDELREDETERKNIIEYENFFGTIKGDIKDQIWYKKYVSKFDCSDFYQADRKIHGVDLSLMYQLLSASYSVDVDFRKNDSLIEVGIVKDAKSRVTFISELLDNQILELLKIFCVEQIKFPVVIKKDISPNPVNLHKLRQSKINLWKQKLNIEPTVPFNFQDFINELRQDENSKENIIEYENFFGTIKGDIKDQIWYKKYVSKFDCSDFYQADRKIYGVDLSLIYQLLSASYSLDIDFRKNESLIEIGIIKDAKSKEVTFTSELSDNQMYGLLKVFCEEQIKFPVVIKKDISPNPANLDELRQNKINLCKKNLSVVPITEYVSSIESEILSCLS